MEQANFLSSLAAVNLGSSSDDDYERPPPQSTGWAHRNHSKPAPALGVQLTSGATAKISSLCGDLLKDALESSGDEEDRDSSESSDWDYEQPSEEPSENEAHERVRARQWEAHNETGMNGVWSDGTAKREFTVILNVYKLPYYHVFGAYHTGVELEGLEHAFRAGAHPGSGVFECKPCRARGYEYKESVMMGVAESSPQAVEAVLKDLYTRFRAQDYSLTHRNCNHYSDALCTQLLGRGIPKRLNRLASIGASLSSGAAPSMQQREKEHADWCEQQELAEQRECEELGRKAKKRLNLSALYMRGVVERRFESYAEVDGSRKVIELRRQPDFDLLKVTREVPPPTECARKWDQ
eukprot:TRINITY_DN21838_c0_g1_i1.p1 TRINITY_DN21838_c0_g1~~TRINITY_DN21838_c0_g1_i1.p1  ORF type:complete len:352 (-),score=102.20 TRINITY_DN21838_c0_g1_i1:59-1114(-)